MDAGLTAARWDEEYRGGRYAHEPPLPFVDTILEALEREPTARHGPGLYVGCGNGRNYLPLVDAGLDVLGLDISPEAIKALAARRPALPPERLLCQDFHAFRSASPFAYLVAIQVFQHGDEAAVARAFARAAALLAPGGLFFMRVNAASTEVWHAHTVVEENGLGGFTIRYDAGPKTGLLVHFASRAELVERLAPAFVPVLEPIERVTVREPPKTGAWAQWEAIARRK